ncbi:MAG: endonuclease/exonuclease/phosphatase family protein [Candidatus Omnitrophica bacterium]|nr:endonuclease/exonuclease/phosphatase family protein [Candidatus Omnitrophota bacterium]
MIRFKTGKHYHNYFHSCKPRYASLDPAHHRVDPKETIKVITYNIKLSRNTRQALKLLAGHDDLDNADIICLQEMDHQGVKLIADTLKHNFVYYPAIFHPRNNKDFGNAILSKWPIIDDRKIILPKLGTGELQRIAVSATLLINSTKVTVFCVHMKLFVRSYQRRIPIDRMIDSIDPSVKHSIIAGDFNTFSKSNCQAILKPFKEADFQLATHAVGWTYKHWYLLNKKSTLDHIFTRGMSVVNTGKVINRIPSDHIPVWGELKID